MRSLSQVPFYFGRGFSEDLELPKKLFRDIQISHLSQKKSTIRLLDTGALDSKKFHSITQSFKLSHLLTNSYLLTSHFSGLNNLTHNLRASTVSAVSRRKRYFSAIYRGAHSNFLAAKYRARGQMRKLFRLRSPL